MHAATMRETVELIRQRIEAGIFTQHVAVNVAKLVHMRHDAELRKSVVASDIINIDGMGVVWGARFLGHQVPERIAGIDLFGELLKLAEQHGYPVFFLGATSAVVAKTAEESLKRYPGLIITGTHNGYFWDDEDNVVEKIRASGAKMLFVAITSPKKENFINRSKNRLGARFVMGVGGTFDVMAGEVARAPKWMQHAGLEWFFRLIQEPRRLARRYLSTNMEFAWLLLRARISSRSSRAYDNT
jgi:N-acetylglucosaminyldiphosphoundecaprenol N-acetyl-beta-D-mannosaminyltransferase